ncbi:MAG: hypothetical protein ACP5PQ_06810 [Thermoproteota archaeon]
MASLSMLEKALGVVGCGITMSKKYMVKEHLTWDMKVVRTSVLDVPVGEL